MKRLLALTLVSTSAMLSPTRASALPDVYTPWTCGATYRVSQGHGAGTFSHNDPINYWAWDFSMPVGTELLAPADGVVRAMRMSATQGGCSASYINDANYVVIQFTDGTEANYVHLQGNSSPLSVGLPVKRGDLVGRVGLTGYVCGAHLHFQFQGTCGSYACNSIQGNFVGIGDPGAGVDVTSNNCPAPKCELALNSAAPLLIDEKNESCFERITSYFWPVAEGDGGHHYYTFTTALDTSETIGRWHFEVQEPGTYDIQVHVPSTQVSATQVTYTIHTTAGEQVSAPLNQAATQGWASIGVFDLAAGPAWVELADNLGEETLKVGFDAIQLQWVVLPEPEPEPEPEPDYGDVGTGADAGYSPSDDVGVGGSDLGGGGEDYNGEMPDVIDSRGSACSAAGVQPSSPLLALMVFAGMLLRRTRKRD